MRSFGGRAAQFQRVRRVKPPRAPAATFPLVCVAESFDQVAESPIGPDLAWVEGHGGLAEATTAPSPFFPGVLDGTLRTGNVVGNALALRAPDDADLPLTQVDMIQTDQWGRHLYFLARETTASIGSDQRVTAVIDGIGPMSGVNTNTFASQDFLLVARTGSHPDEELAVGAFSMMGWLAYFTANADGTTDLDISCSIPPPTAVSLGFFTVVDVSNIGVTLAEGDALAMEVSGVNPDVTVRLFVNDVENLVATPSDVATFLPGLGATTADLPNGTYAGVGLHGRNAAHSPFQPYKMAWSHAAMDDTVRLDNYQACPL